MSIIVKEMLDQRKVAAEERLAQAQHGLDVAKQKAAESREVFKKIDTSQNEANYDESLRGVRRAEVRVEAASESLDEINELIELPETKSTADEIDSILESFQPEKVEASLASAIDKIQDATTQLIDGFELLRKIQNESSSAATRAKTLARSLGIELSDRLVTPINARRRSRIAIAQVLGRLRFSATEWGYHSSQIDMPDYRRAV